MKHLDRTELYRIQAILSTDKYNECLNTLEHVLNGLRYACSSQVFNPSQKRYISTLIHEGDTAIKGVSE